MSLRDATFRIGTPWMQRRVFGRIRWGIRLLLDADWALLEEGIKARMPGVGTPEALPYIGNDRQIDRGPSETDASYIERLRGAFDTWRTAGNVRTLLEQLRFYFYPADLLSILAVSNRGVWHAIEPVTGVVTKQVPAANNWVWDEHEPTRWWRGWIVIDVTGGKWVPWQVGTSGKVIGDPTLTIGSTATPQEVASVRKIVLKWKPAHVHAMHIVLHMAPAWIDTTAAPGSPMPVGDFGNPVTRRRPGCYWQGGM